MAYDSVRLLPRSVLFGDPEYAGPRLSPNGGLLGCLAPHAGALNVWVGPRGNPELARPVTRDRHRDFRAYGFLLDLASEEERCVTPHGGAEEPPTCTFLSPYETRKEAGR